MAHEGFLDSYLPYLLRRADQALSAAFYDALTQAGVPRSEWRLLSVLLDHGPLSIRELTHLSLSPQPTVTHAVGRLEQKGLVQRTQGVGDKRQRFVSLTASGRRLTTELVDDAAQLERAVLDEAGLGDLDELCAALQKLIVAVETHPSEEEHP